MSSAARRPWTVRDWAHTRTALGEKSSEAELVKMVADRCSISDPLTTTTIAMPPKGGNPALSDKDIRNGVASLRTLDKVS